MKMIESLRQVVRREDIPPILRRYGRFDFVAEIGVCDGKHLTYMHGFNPHMLVGVDLWEGKYAGHRLGEDMMKKIRADCPGVVLKRGISWEMATEFPNRMFDYVYIDAAHDYESVAKDIEAWWPKVKPEGVFAGHDYAECERNNFGVIEAVDEFVAREHLELIVTRRGTRRKYKTWLTVKP